MASHNTEAAIWEEFRRQMPITRRWAYFDNAAVAPLPAPTQRVISEWSQQAMLDGDVVWSDWVKGVERTRETAATLLGAERRELALVSNTTAGISLIAEGLDWQSGDNVVTLSNEFPTNIYPWLNLESRGVETRLVPVEDGKVDLNRISDHLDRRTRLLALSWISFCSGWRVDVAEVTRLAHERGVLVLLDAIQGVGVFPIDVRQAGVDFLAADGHKWMLGPEGAGLLYIAAEHLPRLRPLGVGWNSVVHSHDYSKIEFSLKSSASRYEGGSCNMPGFLGLGASLKLLAQLGVGPAESPVADRIDALLQYARQQLEAHGARVISSSEPAHRSGILLFDLPGADLGEVRRRCRDAGVVVSCRGGLLRISPHAYVDESDVDRLVDVVQSTSG